VNVFNARGVFYWHCDCDGQPCDVSSFYTRLLIVYVTFAVFAWVSQDRNLRVVWRT